MSDLQSFDGKFLGMLEQIKEMFIEYGIKSLNMDDISRKLGVSKKTLYRYVESKESLIEKIFQYENEKWTHFIQDLSKRSLNAIDKLFEVSLRVHQEMKNFNPRIIFELQKFYEPLFNKYMLQRRSFIGERMRINLDQGMREGLYRKDLNSDLVVTLYLNHLVEIDNYAIAKSGKVTFDQVFEVMFENHIRAISTPEGVAYFERRQKEVSDNVLRNEGAG